MKRFSFDFDTFLFRSAMLLLLAILIWVIWWIVYEIRHPCKKYGEPQQCQSGGYFINNGKGVNIWIPINYYECRPCIER